MYVGQMQSLLYATLKKPTVARLYTTRTTKTGLVSIENGTAVMDCSDGKYILRRVGKDSKRLEEVFKKLEGRYLVFFGRIVRQYFFASSWATVTADDDL